MVLSVRHKVAAYIIRNGRLLVFRHPDHSEAGVQVPAGTIEPGESPEAAVLREAREETGLRELRILASLGVGDYLSALGGPRCTGATISNWPATR